MIRRSSLLLAVALAAAPAFAQTISNIKPTSAAAGSGPLTLTINGQFSQVPAPTVYWQVLATEEVTTLNIVSGPSLTQIIATIPASLLTQPGTAQVYVTQGTNASNLVNFTITPPTTAPPLLSSLSPTSAPAGSPALTLTVNGSNFPAAGTSVTWNGSPLATSYVNSGQLTAAVPASLLASPGNATVNISAQPQPSPLTFTITPAALTLSSISPTNVVAGSPGFTLTANGSGFTNTTVVTWNGSSLNTSFVSSAQLTAAVPASLIATAGTASVGVIASGQTSPAPLTVTINPSLTITTLSPASAQAGGAAFNLTVNGTGFNSGSVVYWNSIALSGMAVNSGQMVAAVPATLIAQPGTASITVQNGTLVSNAVTFTFPAPALSLTSLSPSTAIAGGPAFTLTANGAGFINAAVVTWNGSPLSTTFVSASQITALIPANLIATAGTASVGVSVAGESSPAPLSFVITPALTITSLSPPSVPAGSPSAFLLTVNGAGFAAGTNVLWNGLVLPTTVVNANLMTASVPANLIAQMGTASITAQNGSVVSNAVTFSITGAQTSVTLSSLSPSSAPVGSQAFTLTVNGSGFISGISSVASIAGSVVTWNGSPLTTTFVSTTQLTAVVPASLLTTAGTAAVSVTGQPQPASLPFTISNAQTLTLTSVSPSTVSAGGPTFTLTVNGTGFITTTTVTWNGSQLATTFVSATQLTATVPAVLIASSGTIAIDVSVSAGQTPPAALPVAVTQGLTLTSLTPSSTTAGGAAFTLTVNGSGFGSSAAVLWNGAPLTTTFVNATQLTAAVSAPLIAQPGSASVTVTSGSLASNVLAFSITAPGPVITSISPATVAAGGPALTLTVSGTGFVSGAVVSLNSMPLTTTFVSATQVTAAVPAALTAQPGAEKITLTNPSGLTSNAVALTITAPTPVISSISPSTVTVGGPAFTLTVNGTGFASGGVVSLNGAPLTTTFVSATQVTAGVPTTYTVQPGTAQITFANPSGPASNAVPLTITAPVPVLTSISPSTVASSGPAFTLIVTGTGFLTGATVSFNSTALITTVVSATQLTAAVPANLITQPGTASITATNTGTAASNAINLTISPSTPTITGISPTSVTAGGLSFTLTVNGSGFLAGASVFVNGISISTTVVSATQLTAQVPANLIAQPATLQITAGNQGGSQSVAATLTVSPAGPSLTSIAPVSANVGDPAFTLTLTGSGFVQGTTVQWNGLPLGTTFVSATQLTATVDAGRLMLPGTASVTVANQVPGGTPLVSNALTFTINAVVPVVSSISPNSITAGSPAFSLTVNGSGFLTLTTVQWNTTTLTTHFISATQVTADVPATLLAQAGTVTVTAVNPGNSVSAAFTFTINPSSPPVISSLSQTSATAGGAAFTLTVTGTGFISGAAVSFGSTALTTTFVSATQLTAAVPASLLLTPTTYQVVVQQGGSSSNALSFAVNLPPPPALSLSPPATSLPAQQPTIGFALNAGYPLPLSGTVTLTFASNATVPVDDPSIQFASGGRTFTFSVPPNTTTLPALLIQTGTVAGVITLNVSLTAAGVDVTPTTGSSATITIQKAAPVIRTVTLIHANGYLEADINGFSTTRDMTTAVFTLNPAPGGSFTSSVITVPVSTLFTSWYQSSGATAFGSQFTYAQPFTVIGDTNQILTVTVSLSNSTGTSVATISK